MINQTLCTSFKAQVLLGVHDFHASGGSSFYIALYTSLANLGADTTQYTFEGECSGPGYVSGGMQLTSLGAYAADGTGYVSFEDAVFTGVTLTTRGALIYNAAPSAEDNNGNPLTNPAVCVLDFGEDKVVTGNDLTITFPTNASSTAIIRIA